MRLKKNRIILFITLLLAVFPSINLLGYNIPVLYIFLPVCSQVFLAAFLGIIKIPKSLKIVIFLFSIIIVEIFISTYFGTVAAFDKFIFPTDTIQYIARLLFFTMFAYVFYKGRLSANTFIKYFLIILNVGMLIGILQWIPWPGRVFLVKLYPFRDGTEQLAHLNRSLSGIRVHGIAQFATANGGLAVMFFVFGYSAFRYYKKHRMLAVSLMCFSVVNIFISQARAGILALAFSLFLIYFIELYIRRRFVKPTMYMLIVLTCAILIFSILYFSGNPIVHKMVSRWERLIETQGGARVDQAKYFFSLLKSTMDYIFGLSKQVVNESDYSYGVEIEPINIFITYGLMGFLLQYLLIFVLLMYFLKRIKRIKKTDNKACLALLVSSFISLFSYQVFSIAYYFFREIRVGLFPWILMGVAMGVYERYRRIRLLEIRKRRITKESLSGVLK